MNGIVCMWWYSSFVIWKKMFCYCSDTWNASKRKRTEGKKKRRKKIEKRKKEKRETNTCKKATKKEVKQTAQKRCILKTEHTKKRNRIKGKRWKRKRKKKVKNKGRKKEKKTELQHKYQSSKKRRKKKKKKRLFSPPCVLMIDLIKKKSTKDVAISHQLVQEGMTDVSGLTMQSRLVPSRAKTQQTFATRQRLAMPCRPLPPGRG